MPYLEMNDDNTTLTKEQRSIVDQAIPEDELEGLLEKSKGG